MTEWWSYRPADFLMFAPRTYWRLFELQNEALWPAQPLLIVVGLAWLVEFVRRGGAALRAGAAGLALAWGFVAWSFLLQRFAPINWAAQGYAVMFFVQALGLAALAMRGNLQAAPRGVRYWVGLSLCAWSLMGHPLLAPIFGRPWAQAEVFGLAPDPTVIGTLGFLLLVGSKRTATQWLLRGLWALALSWCVVSAMTLWTMGVMSSP